MVIFGGTGDLAGRKLFPALYNLAKSKMLSQDFAIVGVGRNEYTNEQYRQVMGEKLQSFATGPIDPELRDWLLQRVYYIAGDFQRPAVLRALASRLWLRSSRNHNTQGNYFFYLATSPAFFGDIVDHLGAVRTGMGGKTATGGVWFLKSLSATISNQPRN